MAESSNPPFTDFIIACIQLRQTITDHFFVELLDKKLKSFIEASQDANLQSKLRSVESLLELLAQIEHLGIGEKLPILTCREQLLRSKLATMPKEATGLPIPLTTKPVINRFPERTKKASKVREEILVFIRKRVAVRTKEIIDQFSAVSERTIKRSLKDLVQQGLVEKQSENNATHYSAL